MGIKKTDFIKILGIGVFLFLSVLEFSGLIGYSLQHLQIAFLSESVEIYWLPELIGLWFFCTIMVWALNRVVKLFPANFSKLLLILVLVYVGVFLVQFLYPFVGTDFILSNYVDEYSSFYESRRTVGNQVTIGTLQLTKYLFFGFLLYFKT